MSKASTADRPRLGALFDVNPSDPETPTEDDGPVRGWTIEGRSNDRYAVPTALDFVPLDTWSHDGLPCVLLAVTRYYVGGYATRRREEWEYEERETTYVGLVYCPPVETPNAAYSGVRPTRKDGGDWFQTGAADDLRKPRSRFDTLAEAVRYQTQKLASGLVSHAEETVCECGWKRTNDKFGHDDGCPAEPEAAWLPGDVWNFE
jgi:hypothetical protein